MADGADDIWGGQGADVATGDNADLTRATGSDCPAEPNGSAGYDCNTFRLDAADVVIRRIQLSDVATTSGAAPAGASGGDTIGGQDGHDRLYGQGGDDWIEGGGNDDFAFGNADSDTIFGGDGQDDLIGGTGRTDSADQATATDGRLDAGDIIHGEGDFDAIAGDNARMVRQTQDGDTGPNADSTGLWKANTFNSAVDRLIALIDVGIVGAPAAAGTSGNDQLLGGAADDTVYGQGGNDGISGGADQDLLEGNANGTGNAPDPAGTYGGSWPTFAGDVIHGDDGADDIAGGTGWIYRMVGGVETADPVAASVRIGADGRLDGGDTLFGDGGGDAVAGDNTVIERALTPAGAWILDDLHSPDALGVVRRVMRQRDVATMANLAPLTNGTSGADVIFGNDGPDLAYGQGGEDAIQGNAGDDHLEGSASDDTITGNEGRDDIIGGTGRTFSNDESTATPGRIDNPAGDDAANDTLHGGNGLGAVAADDDDVIAADNATIDRARGTLGTPGSELNRLPFNGTWGEATWDEPNILRVVRLLDVATTANTAPEANGTNGDDTVNGEANEDVLFGQGGNDTIKGDDADLDGADVGDAGGDDYIEGNGGADMIHGNLGEDDIAGGGSAANGILDANRDGTLDPTRSGETLRDGNDLIAGDSGLGTAGDGDVIAGDNARIQRPLAAGDWRVDPQRKDLDAEPGAQLRDVFLFDIELVGTGEPGDAATGESGVDTISGNGGEDILIGQGNGAVPDAYGTESGIAGPANCQNATGGPGSGTLSGTEEAPNGDDDNDDLPDLDDPQCRTTAPGDTLLGETGEDYIEGNQGSDNAFGGEGEDDVVGGSSSNTGHLNVILPPADRDAGFAPGAITDANRPFNLIDGHDVIEGNAEDDIVAGDNAFVDRYTGAAGAWLTMAGPGAGPFPATDRPNSEPARAAYTATDMVRRDVTTRTVKESAGAFGNDYVRGGGGKDDVYGLLGNDWLEGNEDEDAIVGDMGKIVDNQLGGPTPDTVAGSAAEPVHRSSAAVPRLDDQLRRHAQARGHPVRLRRVAAGHRRYRPRRGARWRRERRHPHRPWRGSRERQRRRRPDLARRQLHADDRRQGQGTGADGPRSGRRRLGRQRPRPHLGRLRRRLPRRPARAAGRDARHRHRRAIRRPGSRSPAARRRTTPSSTARRASRGSTTSTAAGIRTRCRPTKATTVPSPATACSTGPASTTRYYLCPSTYGDWVSTRSAAPGLLEFLQSMSQGFGATTTATAGTSGFRETAIVFQSEHGKNTNPIHPDTPAHFTCGPGIVIP